MASVKVVEYSFENERWKELDFINSEYDKEGNILSEYREDSEGNMQFDYSYLYDGSNMTTINGKRLRSGECITYRYEYNYDENDNQVRGIRFDGDEIVSIYEAKYDENNQLIEGINTIGGKIDYKYTATYDSNGQLISEAKYKGYTYKGETRFQLEYRMDYIFDENGNVVEEKKYNDFSELEYHYIYQYEGNNMIGANKLSENGLILSSYSAVYSDDNLTEFTITDKDGAIIQKHQATYQGNNMISENDITHPPNIQKVYEAKYDETGNKLEEINYEEEIGGELFVSKYVYLYDDHNNCIEETYYIFSHETEKWIPISKQTNAILYY